MTTTCKSFLTLALCLTVVMGVAGSAMAWHGNGGHWGGGHGGGHRYEHSGYASNVDYNAHGGGHEWAADNATIHERELKDPNHRDGAMDYVAPHKKTSNCEGMTGPHGRHID